MLRFKFNDEVHSYQKFVVDNIKMLGNLIIITEQLYLENINKNYIDILALDLDSKRLVILELKNETAKDSILSQSIRYYDLLINAKEDLTILLETICDRYMLNIDDINFEPKVMLVVPDFSKQIIKSYNYIKNIDIEIVKFNLYKKINSFEIIKEYSNIKNEELIENKTKLGLKISQKWDYDEYLKEGINQNIILLIKQTINYINNLLPHKNLNVYFYKNKVTLFLEKKKIADLLFNNKFKDEIELSIKLNSIKKFNSSILLYNGEINNYKILSNSIKIKFSRLPSNILRELEFNSE